MEQTSIFHRITNQNENTSTEILCNLFRNKYFRDICLSFFGLPENAIKTIKSEHCSTQQKLLNIGIPDLIIQNNEVFYIIENKIKRDTPLQSSQTTSYVDVIKKDCHDEKGLIFLIPHDYEHVNEIVTAQKSCRFISISYWEEFLKFLYDSAVVKEALDFLCNLIIIEPVETNLTPYEVAMMYNPKDVVESISLIQKVYELIKKTEPIILSKLGKNFSEFHDCFKFNINADTGFYFNYKKNEDAIFIGLCLNLIESEDKGQWDYFFSVAFDVKALKKQGKDDITTKHLCYNGGDWIYFKMDRKLLLSKNQEEVFVENVCKIINKVYN
jgi:hypothetical protein